MASRIDAVQVSMPDLHAVRLESTTLHVGVKEHYAIARVERGRSEWWSRGKLWEREPGTLQFQEPGDLHRDIRTAGPLHYQIVSFSAETIERELGRKLKFEPQLEAADPRALPFHRLHDAIEQGADRLALEVAVAEALAGLAAV